MLYHNKSLADLFLAFTVAGQVINLITFSKIQYFQLVALVCLIGVLMFFASSLRDDPLPATAADAPENNIEAAVRQLSVPEEEPFTGEKTDEDEEFGGEDECFRKTAGEKAMTTKVKSLKKIVGGTERNGTAT